MNAHANVPARRSNDPVARLNDQLQSRAEQFRMVLPNHISLAKFQRTILTAVQTNPKLLNADRTSLILACMKAAQDGLLPDGREAALVIYSTRKKINGEWMTVEEVQYQSMVYGVRKKIRQSREIKDINAFVVYKVEVDEGCFIYEEGTERMLRHKPKLDISEEEARDENIVAVYSMAIYNDGSPSFKVMRRFEVDKRRQMSKTGAIGQIDRRTKQPIEPKGPWVDWYPEQAMKTVLRNHAKMLPSSGDITPDIEEIEDEMAARSAQAALVGDGGQPVALPQHNPETGEIVAIEDRSGTEAGMQIKQQLNNVDVDDQAIDAEMSQFRTDSRGMSEVDEETARRLDANDGTLSDDNPAAREGHSDEQHGDQHDDAPEATFSDPNMPANAKHGDSWWNGEKLKYAHDKGRHGIKWYLQPPAEADAPAREEPAHAPEEQAAIADQVVEDIDGPLDPHRGQVWAERRRELIDAFKLAESKDDITRADNELVRHLQGFPDEIQVELEGIARAERKRVAAEAARRAGGLIPCAPYPQPRPPARRLPHPR